MTPLVYLGILTLVCWIVIIFLHSIKKSLTLIPLFTFISLSTLLGQYLSDLNYAVALGTFSLHVGTVAFFTSVLLGVLLLYLFEGPRGARLAMWVINGTTVLYLAVIGLMSSMIETTTVNFTWQSVVSNFWSIVAVVLDVFFMGITWELLSRKKGIPLFFRVFLVVLGTFILDTVVYITGAFSTIPAYTSILIGALEVRVILAFITSIFITLYLSAEGYKETGRDKPKNFWEILNFHSDLELKVATLSQVAQREKEINLQLSKFQQSLDAVSDQIVIANPKGTVIYANPAMETMTGYTRKEALGSKAGTLWGKQMPPEFYKKLWNTINNKKNFEGELINKRKTGGVYEALIKISPVLDDDGNIEYFVGIERDISRERQLERAKDEFLSMASHELRTPLTAIDGIVSMIRDGDYGEVNKNLVQPLDDINAASARLIALVNDLLNVSRIEAGRLKYDLAECDPNDDVQEVAGLLKGMLQSKKIDFSIQHCPPTMVVADKNKVKQVMSNLVGNAIKFTEKGLITVRLVQEPEQVVIYIQDTGVGIKTEDKNKLFQKFEQLGSDKSRQAGTGLGLYISKQICQKMGGDLWLDTSDYGKGSTFAFSLPRTGTTAAKAAAREIASEQHTHPDQKSDTDFIS